MPDEPNRKTPVRPLTSGRRFRLLPVYLTTARVLLDYGLLAIARRLRRREWSAGALSRAHRRNARRVLRAIVRVQGLFIKVGQLVSILSSVLPADFREELETLQDQIPPRPWAEIRARLHTELGRDPVELFRELETEPIAAASLAQVHAGRLADGRRVAVKVQHLGIERLAELDLRAARRILAIVGLFTGARGLDVLFEEVSQMIREELDFVSEADHIDVIAANFRDDPSVGTPTVLRELSTSRVLVTTFVDGVKVTDVETLDAKGVDRPDLAERLLRAYCQMIFIDGVYHADPHPGNIFVDDGGRIVFVDFGAMGKLSERMRSGIPTFLEAVLRRDRDAILRSLERMGFVQREPGDDVAERVIDYVYSRFLDEIELESWNLKDIHFDAEMKLEVIADLRNLDLSVRDLTATFQVPREWILLERTLMLLLGVCTRIHPEMRPMATIRPYVEQLVLGGGRDWIGLVRSVVKDLAMTALTLPGDLERLLKKAERGEAALEIRGLRESTTLLYALGHQLLYGAFSLTAGGLAALAQGRGEEALGTGLIWASGVFALLLAGSIWRARRWERAVRRGTKRRPL